VRSIGARFGNQDSVGGEEDGKVKRRRTRVGRGIAGENKKGARWIRHENKEKREEEERNGFVCHTSNTRPRTKPMSNEREIDTIYQKDLHTASHSVTKTYVIDINSCAV